MARNQLLVEGLATDPNNPVLRELATKLHRHQIGAIKFVPGVPRNEMAEVLQVLSRDPRSSPAGLVLRDFDTRWDHIRMLPPAYERLELADGRQRLGEHALTDTVAGRLWMGLAARPRSPRKGRPSCRATRGLSPKRSTSACAIRCRPSRSSTSFSASQKNCACRRMPRRPPSKSAWLNCSTTSSPKPSGISPPSGRIWRSVAGW